MIQYLKIIKKAHLAGIYYHYVNSITFYELSKLGYLFEKK